MKEIFDTFKETKKENHRLNNHGRGQSLKENNWKKKPSLKLANLKATITEKGDF